MRFNEWLISILNGIRFSFECFGIIVFALIIIIYIILRDSSNTKMIDITERSVNGSPDNHYRISNGYYAANNQCGILVAIYHKNDNKE